MLLHCNNYINNKKHIILSVCEAPNGPVMLPMHIERSIIPKRGRNYGCKLFHFALYCWQRWTGFPGSSHASADFTSVPYGVGERAHFCSLFVVPFFLFCVFL